MPVSCAVRFLMVIRNCLLEGSSLIWVLSSLSLF
uniref:Uncharacterized protein n=1 Tax=Anguilla anguilla TaxID=7936 RepID=A0A0E9TIV5_ANGAN